MCFNTCLTYGLQEDMANPLDSVIKDLGIYIY